MTEKRYKSIRANLECSNGMEYMLIKRNDGVNVCQVCSKYTAKEIVDELNNLADENKELKQQMQRLYNYFADWFDDIMSPSDFSEMLDFIKEDENWD